MSEIDCRRESGWVLETARQTYWNGHGLRSEHFVDDINSAIRFARFIDAEVVRVWALDNHSYALRATEHIFGLQLKDATT